MIAPFIAVLIAAVAAYLILSQESGDGAPDVSLDTLGLGGLALGLSDSGQGSGSAAPQPSVPGVPMNTKVIQFAQAIAHAEGFGVPGAVPTRAHNPGDLGPGDCGSLCLGQIAATGSMVCILKDDATGWGLLYGKIGRIFDGQSRVYNVNMTIERFAQSYAGDWMNWSRNVAAQLGVTPQTTIQEWLNL